MQTVLPALGANMSIGVDWQEILKSVGGSSDSQSATQGLVILNLLLALFLMIVMTAWILTHWGPRQVQTHITRDAGIPVYSSFHHLTQPGQSLEKPLSQNETPCAS